MQSITNLFFKSVLKIATPQPALLTAYLINFPIKHIYILFLTVYRKTHRKNYTYNYTYTYLFFKPCVNWLMPAYRQNFPKCFLHHVKVEQTWLLHLATGLILKLCFHTPPHTVFMISVPFLQKTAIISLYHSQIYFCNRSTLRSPWGTKRFLIQKFT